MKSILLILLVFFGLAGCSGHSLSQNKTVNNPISLNQSSESESEVIAETPLLEELVHNSLMKKLELISIHHGFVLDKSKALLNFMQMLEDEKDEDGNLSNQRALHLIESAKFPKAQMMEKDIEALSNNSLLHHKSKYCLQLISQGDEKAIGKYFDPLEEEILADIDSYKSTGMSLPQYRFMLGLYTNAKKSLEFESQVLLMMNPKLFSQ